MRRNASDRTAHRRAAAAGVLAALLCGIGPARANAADNWTTRDFQDFSPAEARRAQVYLRAAMQGPIGAAARRASEIRPEAMLDYGLALVLGRAPATGDLDEAAKARVRKLLETAFTVYQSDIGAGPSLANLDDAVGQGELWVWMSRMLSLSPQTDLDVQPVPGGGLSVSPTAPIAPSPTAENAASGTADLSQGDLLGPDGRAYNLKGDLPVLDPRVVSAAHACSDYAYTAARMKRVTELDPGAIPKLTRAQALDVQTRAASLYKEAMAHGPNACGGEFFSQVLEFAEENLGKVGTLKLAPRSSSTTGP